MIIDHFDGHAVSSELRFVCTDQRGTGADLIQCLDAVPDSAFIVWNGDTILDLDIADLLAYGENKHRSAVIVLTRQPDAPNHDAWYVDADGTVRATLEAAHPQSPPLAYAWRGSSTGTLLLNKSHLVRYRNSAITDLYSAILPALIYGRILTAYDNGTRYFLDFGTPQALARIDASQVTGWAS